MITSGFTYFVSVESVIQITEAHKKMPLTHLGRLSFSVWRLNNLSEDWNSRKLIGYQHILSENYHTIDCIYWKRNEKLSISNSIRHRFLRPIGRPSSRASERSERVSFHSRRSRNKGESGKMSSPVYNIEGSARKMKYPFFIFVGIYFSRTDNLKLKTLLELSVLHS